MTPSEQALHEIQEVLGETVGESAGLGGIRLVVSPAAGRLRQLPPVHLHDGHEWAAPGQTLALVEQGSARVEVHSPVEGRVVGFLVRSGEPVAAGQPIVWVEEQRQPGSRHQGGER